MNRNSYNPVLNYFALFSSASTLICCALPSLMVGIGAGAVFATMIESAPFLIILSEYKIALFSCAFTALVISGIVQWQAKAKACPSQKEAALACQGSRKWSSIIYKVSWGCFLVAGFVTFVLPVLI